MTVYRILRVFGGSFNFNSNFAQAMKQLMGLAQRHKKLLKKLSQESEALKNRFISDLRMNVSIKMFKIEIKLTYVI